jgi:hypothetical protein
MLGLPELGVEIPLREIYQRVQIDLGPRMPRLSG